MGARRESAKRIELETAYDREKGSKDAICELESPHTGKSESRAPSRR